MIFIGAYLGGRIQDRRGPRTVALAGGVIYGIGVLLAGFAGSADELWLLVLGYGVISGFGLGVAYIVPIAMLQKWFPDKRGLITGLAVGVRLRRRPHRPGRQLADRREPRRADARVHPARHRLPGHVADRRVVLPQPSEGYVVPGHEAKAADAGKEKDFSARGHDYEPGEALRTPSGTSSPRSSRSTSPPASR